jgi:hypothetical protein
MKERHKEEGSCAPLSSKLEYFVIQVVILIRSAYNKSVIIIHRNSNKSVKGCFYGTTDFVEATGLEKFALSQAANFKGCAAGGQDMGPQGIWQTLL